MEIILFFSLLKRNLSLSLSLKECLMFVSTQRDQNRFLTTWAQLATKGTVGEFLQTIIIIIIKTTIIRGKSGGKIASCSSGKVVLKGVKLATSHQKIPEQRCRCIKAHLFPSHINLSQQFNKKQPRLLEEQNYY